VIDVTDRSDIDVRLGALELLFHHDGILLQVHFWVRPVDERPPATRDA
jgi:hypothetical protein